MIDIELSDASVRWDELIDLVDSCGASFQITRQGMPVARLVPAGESVSVASGIDMLSSVRASSRPGPGSLAELIRGDRI